MTNSQENIHIRLMKAGEEKSVLNIMRRAFPLFMRVTFSENMVRSAEKVLVACADGEIKGGVILKTFKLPGGGNGGVVDWIFTDPSGRGLGLGIKSSPLLKGLIPTPVIYLLVVGSRFFLSKSSSNGLAFLVFLKSGLNPFTLWIWDTFYGEIPLNQLLIYLRCSWVVLSS